MKYSLFRFFRMESSIGILLISATAFAMIMANSIYLDNYNNLIKIPVTFSFGDASLSKPLLLWINDGLMAIFFFMVGLEIKREVVGGSLHDKSKFVLPAIAALGGMIVPALIYVMFNYASESAMKGWAIPMATDIAFALGILSLLGKRVPSQLKLFLLTLAIIDDLGAILVIAIYYTSSMNYFSLAASVILISLLIGMNKSGVKNHTAYILVGLILWIAVLKSGVHATIAGVVLGLIIPIKDNKLNFYQLENSLHIPVNFVILPIFAFANAGIYLFDIGLNDLTDNMTLGIIFGLFFGKQIGVFLFTFVAHKLGFGSLAKDVTWMNLYGLAVLSGVGFTMSLFVGSLAFECHSGTCFDLVDYRMGILIGSLLSGIVGYFIILKTLKKKNE